MEYKQVTIKILFNYVAADVCVHWADCLYQLETAKFLAVGVTCNSKYKKEQPSGIQ